MRKRIEGFSKLIKTQFNKLRLENAIGPQEFIGKELWVVRNLGDEPEKVLVTDIKGCVAEHLAKYFQISGKYLCHMFSAYTQLIEGRVPSEAELQEFEIASDIKDIKEVKN